jgi:subtilisin family serine protease
MVGLVLALVLTAMPVAATVRTAAPPGAAKIERGLLDRLDSGSVERFIVEFAARADLSRAPSARTWADRGTRVRTALTATAERSQAAAASIVRATKGAHAQGHWLTNIMVVDGDRALAERLAAQSEVKTVRAERRYPLVEPVSRTEVAAAAEGETPWGITKIGADDAWADGVLGAGVVVANIDTGVDYTHPALVNQYRGNLGGGVFDHDYSWWDPTGLCGDAPCDTDAHGTHTMGTIVGGDGPGPFTPDIGVAPGARWIAAKGCESSFCTETSLVSSGEFMIAPTDVNGLNPDPSKRPDIVSNSWGGSPNDEFYLEVVSAWRAAGIVPVFASGNPGPLCGDGGSPGDYVESFSAGATNINDQIADFSGRGPSAFGKVNPDIAAPGVDVVSSVPGGSYDSFSGTSMATPHTAGTLALVLSAEIGLAGNVTGMTDPVRSSALDHIDTSCGGDSDGDPNNVFGDGRIDAHAAVTLVKTGGTLAGVVTDSATHTPIAGAQIEASLGGRDFHATTDATGHYDLFLAAGTYSVAASAFGYGGQGAGNVVIVTDQTTSQSFGLTALPRRDITGTVTAAEDGSPINAAEVVALGTPVAPTRTNAAGQYSLTMPIGTYTIRIAAGGCTSADETEVTVPLAGVVHDVSLSRKLDDFGHGCAPIAFDWVQAKNQTSLFGDEVLGRLNLPFAFPFYGKTYSRVYVSDNGYLTFQNPAFAAYFPHAIPSAEEPNAAIYALWQNWEIDDTTNVKFATVKVSTHRAFVLEYEDLKAGPIFNPGGANANAATAVARADLEVKLWDDGRIDVLYGDNPANPGDGRNSSIGIESHTGTDALQFALFDDLISPKSAYRYEVVPTGTVTGTVTDANDGLPIKGATITASPGSRTTKTDAAGAYSLRLRPGTYALEFAAERYVSEQHAGVPVVNGATIAINAALDAPEASVTPPSVTSTVAYGKVKKTTLTLSNPGTAPLAWQLFEREGSRTPPDLPPVPHFVRTPTWSKANLPARVTKVRPAALPPGALPTVIDDPDDDSTGTVELTEVRGGSDNAEMSIALQYSADTPMDQPVGIVMLDTDGDATTGLSPEDLFGLPTQDIGVDYWGELFNLHDSEPFVPIYNTSFELVAEVPATIDGQTISFSVPLEALGGDDGEANIGVNTGWLGPEDWAPDEGHGIVGAFTDAPWITSNPDEGALAPGTSVPVQVTLGDADLPPGHYVGKLVLVSDAPKQSILFVDLDLTVKLPAGWGAAAGTITDAHHEDPVPGAQVVMHATYNGAPRDFTDITRSDGTWSIIGPPGTWSADIIADGFVPVSTEVVIQSGGTLSGQDVALHRAQPHASLDTTLVRLVLRPGETAHASRVIANLEGHTDLAFTVGEIPLVGGTSGTPAPAAVPTGAAARARDTRALQRPAATAGAHVAMTGDVITSWPTDMSLPWGVGFRPGTVTLTDPADKIDVDFTTSGDRLGSFATPWAADWAADLAWDADRGVMWHVNIGGDNGIYGINPTDGSVVDTITGSPWGGISQRGLAYDSTSDTFYIGGWNEGIVYHVAGPSWATPGETLGSCRPDDPNISGLAFNASFRKLWVSTNSESDSIWLIDPDTCETEGGLGHPDPGFNGAGLELDAVGNLWTVSQNAATAYLIESGLPTFADVPWLSVSPEAGAAAVGESGAIDIGLDATGLAPGLYQAMVGVLTNDPDMSSAIIPVDLVVTKYKKFVNVGGGATAFPDGDSYVADKAWSAGTYGYVGSASTVRTTTHAIAGTTHGPVYKSQREGMTGYKLAVPNGLYLVQLEFAELVAVGEFGRIMDISAEGSLVLDNVDIAGQSGGRYRALDREFLVEVHDGVLDLKLVSVHGGKPILNGLRATWMPPGAA